MAKVKTQSVTLDFAFFTHLHNFYKQNRKVIRNKYNDLTKKYLYCFDSKPEQTLFWQLLRDGLVKEIYFTGMLTHGQTDFFVQYIDPESHTVRSYYPDFLFKRQDDTYVIVEVKGDNKIDDPVVQAKKRFAEQMAQASGMLYHIIKGSDANKGNYRFLLTNDYPYQAELTTEE